MTTTKPRFSLTIDDELFEEIEDFRYENRYPSRNEAVIELLRLGLEAHKQKNNAEPLKKRNDK